MKQPLSLFSSAAQAATAAAAKTTSWSFTCACSYRISYDTEMPYCCLASTASAASATIAPPAVPAAASPRSADSAGMVAAHRHRYCPSLAQRRKVLAPARGCARCGRRRQRRRAASPATGAAACAATKTRQHGHVGADADDAQLDERQQRRYRHARAASTPRALAAGVESARQATLHGRAQRRERRGQSATEKDEAGWPLCRRTF